MTDPTPVNGQITDAITEERSIASGPGATLHMNPKWAVLGPKAGEYLIFEVRPVDHHGLFIVETPVSILLKGVPEGLHLSPIQAGPGQLQGPSTPTTATVIMKEGDSRIVIQQTVESVSQEGRLMAIMTLDATMRIPDPEHPGQEMTLSAQSLIRTGTLPPPPGE